MHYGGAAASGTTTAGGVLIFQCGEDKPKTFSQFLLFKKKMTSLVVEMDAHDTISQKKNHAETNTLLSSRRTYLLKTGHFFFSFWGQAQFLGNSRTAVHLENPPGGLRFRFGSFQEFPWEFPGSSGSVSTGRWRSYIASTHPECGQTLCRDLCKEFPTRAQSRGRSGGGWWVVETPLGKAIIFP